MVVCCFLCERKKASFNGPECTSIPALALTIYCLVQTSGLYRDQEIDDSAVL